MSSFVKTSSAVRAGNLTCVMVDTHAPLWGWWWWGAHKKKASKKKLRWRFFPVVLLPLSLNALELALQTKSRSGISQRSTSFAIAFLQYWSKSTNTSNRPRPSRSISVSSKKARIQDLKTTAGPPPPKEKKNEVSAKGRDTA